MRSRVLAPFLIAGAAALGIAAAPAAGGGARGRPRGISAGGRSGSVAHPGHAGRIAPWSYAVRDPSTGHDGPGGHSVHTNHADHFDRGLPFEWHGGYVGWGPLSLGLPLWWGGYWGWPHGYACWGMGWAYGYGGYYGPYGYAGSFDYDGYPDSVVFRAPFNPEAAESPTGGIVSEAPGEPTVAEPAPSAVDLQVSPRNAFVLLNGVLIGSVEEFGRDSDYLYLDAGEYALEFRAPGFRTRTLQLSVSGGEPTLVSLALRPDPAAGGEPTAQASPGLPHGRRFSPTFGSAGSPPEPPTVPAEGPEA